jgi:mono/diheme cytochrome c family protein
MLAVVAGVAAAHAQSDRSPTRGELLYDAHCIECHNVQIHWRDQKQARNWASLKAQVIRWQAIARLGWDDSDVEEVTRHLNETVYRFPPLPAQAPRRQRIAAN